MKVVVVSDSHGRDDLLYDLQEQYPNADAFLHCGDVEAPQENFPGLYREKPHFSLIRNAADMRRSRV